MELIRDLNKCGAPIVLASASPRRREILALQAGLQHLVIVPATGDLEEANRQLAFPTAEAYVAANALAKAQLVAAAIYSAGSAVPGARVVIGCDTIVCCDHHRLEKPKSPEDSLAALRLLSARAHSVLTAVSLVFPSGRAVSFTEETRVVFGSLSEADIAAYVASGEPADKAGSYGIQGLGAALVDGIEGDYLNVVGFPLRRFLVELSAQRTELALEA
jgi:septum formation protein